MSRPQSEINAEIELHRPEREGRVRRMQLTAAVCEDVAKRMMEGEDAYEPVEIAMDISSVGIVTRIKWLREGCDPESDHSLEPPAVDISSAAIAEWITGFRTREWPEGWTPRSWGRERLADLLEVLVAERDRLANDLATTNSQLRTYFTEDDRETERVLTDATDRAEKAEAERDRNRTFVRSARGIIEMVARDHGYRVDPFGAHAWLSAEARGIGTARDGGDPKVEKAAT